MSNGVGAAEGRNDSKFNEEIINRSIRVSSIEGSSRRGITEGPFSGRNDSTGEGRIIIKLKEISFKAKRGVRHSKSGNRRRMDNYSAGERVFTIKVSCSNKFNEESVGIGESVG
jgi:hypothetical protein